MKDRYLNLLSITILCILGIAIYSNTLNSPFCFDDGNNIIGNFSIRNLSNLKAIWSFLPARFITYLSLAVNYHFNHLDVLGYHLFNIAMHICTSIAVSWLVLLMLSTPNLKVDKISAHSKMIALFAGGIFIAHPIQTESVTNIIQRGILITTFLYILSISFYAKSRLSQKKTSSILYYMMSLSIAVLAAFTRESSVTLPFALIMYEAFFLKDDRRKMRWLCPAPYLIIMFIVPFALMSTDFMPRLKWQLKGLALSDYLFTQFRAIATYLRLSILPVNQNIDYDYPIYRSLFEAPVSFSLMLSLALFTIGVLLYKRRRLVSFAIFLFLLTISAESSLVTTASVIFEHRLYLPMVGFSVFLTGAIYYLFENKGMRLVFAILFTICIIFSILAYNRNAVWRDDLTLWNDAVRKSPNKARPYNNRGNAYQRKGDFNYAISDYNIAIGIDPNYAVAYHNRGTTYQKKGNLDQAISDYNVTVKIDPGYAKVYNDRGNVYQMSDDLDHAISDYDRALEIDPNYAHAYYNRGLIYYARGDFNQAVSDLSKALQIDPINADAHHNRGLIYQMRGDIDQAILDYDKAIQIDSSHSKAYNNGGTCYQLKGDLDRAISNYTKAIAVNPDYSNAYNNRALAYFNKKEYKKAWQDLCKAEALGRTVNPRLKTYLSRILNKSASAYPQRLSQ